MIKSNVLTSPKIKEVKILTRIDLYELERAINGAIEEGWEIYGSLIKRDVVFSMMMVKYEEI